MSRGAKIAIGVVVVLVVVVVVWLVVVALQGRPAPNRLRVRVSGTRPADATFTPDSEGRFPGEPGWVDEGADVEVG